MHGSYGDACERVCTNDCVNDCSGHGICVHGWCRCERGWWGIDCSDSLRQTYRRETLSTNAGLFADSTALTARIDELPSELRMHAERMHQAVYVYDLPPSVNRDAEQWSARFWGKGSFDKCDPVHTRRIYSAETHFTSRLLRDDYTRTLDPSRATLFFVPLLLSPKVEWGALNIPELMRKALHYIQATSPHWNASSGRDHVWFMFGERMSCLVPHEIGNNSIIITHWGDTVCGKYCPRCTSRSKDIVVPPITPIQHDLEKYREQLRPALQGNRCFAPRGIRHGGCKVWEKPTGPSDDRNGPLLLFAGGIVSFGASQDVRRPGGRDTAAKQEKWLRRVMGEPCAKPTDLSPHCRSIYSMGVRQAVWRQKLWQEPDMRIVSAGVPDYLTAVPRARFCLHTEGNSWGTRLIDYMAMECVPVIVNDEMMQVYENILDYDKFAYRFSKQQIPELAGFLRRIDNATRASRYPAIRRYKRGFVWFRPEGLAYEYTLAALGERVAALGLGGRSAEIDQYPTTGGRRGRGRRKGRNARRHARKRQVW